MMNTEKCINIINKLNADAKLDVKKRIKRNVGLAHPPKRGFKRVKLKKFYFVVKVLF